MSDEISDNLRAICMGLPNLTDHHHGDDWIGMWAAAPPGAQESYEVIEDAYRAAATTFA